MTGQKEFSVDIPTALANYPSLHLINKNGQDIIGGTITIIDETGKEWDKYEIEIHSTELYPYRFPLLYEVGGRIPRILDWHIYGDTKSCCMDIRPSEIINCREGLRLAEFIPRFVIPYLANTTHRIKEGYYISGEYSHGAKGLLEYYGPIMKLNDPSEIVRILTQFAISRLSPKTIFHPCFCGSGKQLKNCHKDVLQVLKLVGEEEVRKNISHIKDYLETTRAN